MIRLQFRPLSDLVHLHNISENTLKMAQSLPWGGERVIEWTRAVDPV